MDDLISRQAAIKQILLCENHDMEHDFEFNEGLIVAMNAVVELPTAEPMTGLYVDGFNDGYEAGKAEADPRKGKWLMVEDADEDGNARYECSLCHAGETHTPKVKVSYCWNCGARMEESE